MADGPPRVWRIHLGAHKTATTHLQETLALRQEALRRAGVEVVPVAELRALGLAAQLRHGAGAAGLRGALRRRRADAAVGRIVAGLRARGTRLVLSDENLIGNAGDALARPLYPGAQERIGRLLRRIPPGDAVELMLAVRSFDTLAPSAFAQSLRLRRPTQGSTQTCARALAEPPSWFELVARIAAAAPRARLTVWRYEDYAARNGEILARVCGADPGPPDDLPVPVRNRSPGAAAVAAVEALPPELAGAAWRAEVARIYGASDPAGPRFAPFAPEAAARLRAAYRADLERIAALGPDVLMTFDDRPSDAAPPAPAAVRD
jgi:hypothetical protein